jgi:hypothetical protein
MKFLRKLHLYLGCFFTPILLFFALTGAAQLFDYHQSRKDGSYTAPAWLKLLSDVHIHQRWQHAAASQSFRVFAAAATIGFLITCLLGIYMAFKLSKSKLVVWLCLLGGALLPVLLLMFS